jgi:hypothetical protein
VDLPFWVSQALKYRSENCLTKCSMTLSRTYVYCDVRWLWVQFGLEVGNKYVCRHKLISAQFGKVIWILAIYNRATVKTPHLIKHCHLHFIHFECESASLESLDFKKFLKRMQPDPQQAICMNDWKATELWPLHIRL